MGAEATGIRDKVVVRPWRVECRAEQNARTSFNWPDVPQAKKRSLLAKNLTRSRKCTSLGAELVAFSSFFNMLVSVI